ncbi:MAG: hypothetical protein ACFE8Z_07485 [Candidatus Hermodarchaeota archaeon]
MAELDTLRKGIVSLLDGMWWALRDSVGALSMHEGYSGGFRQMGADFAESVGDTGAEGAARMAAELFASIGLDVEREGKAVLVKSCPIWNRILERGLEYSFHVEEICWKPMLEGIGEKAGAKPVVESSLRLAHLERGRLNHKMGKAKAALEKGKISKKDFESQIASFKQSLQQIPSQGRYRFE